VIVSAEFVASAAGARDFPRDRLPEVALVGRSNVGKSTLINALARRKVARTSAAPGKTRLANFYRVAVEGKSPFYLVDLPGFGYARGGDAARQEFDALAAAYFGNRVTDARFRGAFVLVDSRHPGLDLDRSAWNWLERLGVPAYVVATKIDKLTRSERQRHLAELEQVYSRPVTPSSADTGEGLDELWKTIASLTTTARR
jgi:GTP-binding protein